MPFAALILGSLKFFNCVGSTAFSGRVIWMGMYIDGVMAYFVVLLRYLPGGSWSHHQGLNSIASQVYSRSADCKFMVLGDWLDSVPHKSVAIVSKDIIGLGPLSCNSVYLLKGDFNKCRHKYVKELDVARSFMRI
jgi:hypothetical protein